MSLFEDSILVFKQNRLHLRAIELNRLSHSSKLNHFESISFSCSHRKLYVLESRHHTFDHMLYSSQSLAHCPYRDRKALHTGCEISSRISCPHLGSDNSCYRHEIVSTVKLGVKQTCSVPLAKPIIRARHISLPRWSQIAWTLME